MSRVSSASELQDRRLARAWARLGVLLNVHAAAQTPDLERLLLDTVRASAGNSRLLILAATWLSEYPEYVAKRRLAVLVRVEMEERFRPVMGFLLEWVQARGIRSRYRFHEALAFCRPAERAGPLAAVLGKTPELARLAERMASPLSRRWGTWMEPFDPKKNALRPAEWIAKHNPELALRALSGGDLVASIAADATAGLTEFASESLMARRYDASRAALREALRKLKLAGLATQQNNGKSRRVLVRTR